MPFRKQLPWIATIAISLKKTRKSCYTQRAIVGKTILGMRKLIALVQSRRQVSSPARGRSSQLLREGLLTEKDQLRVRPCEPERNSCRTRCGRKAVATKWAAEQAMLLKVVSAEGIEPSTY